MKKVSYLSIFVLFFVVVLNISCVTFAQNSSDQENDALVNQVDLNSFADILATLCVQEQIPTPPILYALLAKDYPEADLQMYCQKALEEIDSILHDSKVLSSQFHDLMVECKKIITVVLAFAFYSNEEDIDEETYQLLQQTLATKSPKEVFCNLFVKNLLKVCGQAFVEGQLTINPRARITRAVGPILVVNGDADINGTLTADNFIVLGTTTLGNVVFGNATINGTLTVTGHSTLSTVSAGATTLSSLSVINDASVGGTLTVIGNSSLSTLSTSGLATLNSLSVTNNATVSGTLSVTGNTTLNTLSTSGLATLNSLSVTPGDGTFAANLIMPRTTSSAVGVIMAGADRFIHNYDPSFGLAIRNTFVGRDSGNFSLTQGFLTCVGAASGRLITTASHSTLIGSISGQFLTSGIHNTCTGYASGLALGASNNNSLFGSSAGTSLSGGSDNSMLGYNAGQIISSGTSNIFIGSGSGSAITDGNNNIILGSTGPAGSVSGQLYLGSQNQTNLFLMSNAGAGTSLPAQPIAGSVVALTIDTTTGATGYNSSSLRFKTDVKLLPEDTANTLEKLRPVQYAIRGKEHDIAYGFIAEEVAEIDSRLVSFNEENQPTGVHYQMIIPMLIKAYQQQQQRIDDLEARLNLFKP